MWVKGFTNKATQKKHLQLKGPYAYFFLFKLTSATKYSEAIIMEIYEKGHHPTLPLEQDQGRCDQVVEWSYV